jgi:hypothetical protein
LAAEVRLRWTVVFEQIGQNCWRSSTEAPTSGRFIEYEVESESAGPVFQLIGRYAF